AWSFSLGRPHPAPPTPPPPVCEQPPPTTAAPAPTSGLTQTVTVSVLGAALVDVEGGVPVRAVTNTGLAPSADDEVFLHHGDVYLDADPALRSAVLAARWQPADPRSCDRTTWVVAGRHR
ncbi:MAG: hypothetical protein AB7L84_16655, partial [Acidimicrobiia bacterium]